MGRGNISGKKIKEKQLIQFPGLPSAMGYLCSRSVSGLMSKF
jgi:hypothetical protein